RLLFWLPSTRWARSELTLLLMRLIDQVLHERKVETFSDAGSAQEGQISNPIRRVETFEAFEPFPPRSRCRRKAAFQGFSACGVTPPTPPFRLRHRYRRKHRRDRRAP